MTRRRGSTAKEGRSPWDAAAAYGVDMSLIESNLRKTPQERIRTHCRALAAANKLRKAAKSRHA